jgi:purine-binding chemotaxis protein CheW
MTFLGFSVADLRVGVSVDVVVEALLAVAILQLPGAPAIIEGIIDVRGTVVPVFDMRLRLTGSHTDIVPSDRLIITRAAGRLVALHVQDVIGLVELDANALRVDESRRVTTPHIAGIVATSDGLLLIHDLETFLSAAERDTLDAAMGAAALTS